MTQEQIKRQFSFNKIYVIESLFPKETKTGENLFNDLLRWKVEQLDYLNAEYIPVKNRTEFFEFIETVKNEVQNDRILPFLHFEIHGSTEKDGLVLNSNELITWLELANRFREINILTKHNLVVSLATCFGAYLYQEIRPVDKAPFWGFIAPWEEVNPIDIEVNFNSFFDTLLSTSDFNYAVTKLNEENDLPYQYHFYNAEMVFERILEKYEEESYSPENYNNRVINLITQALSDYNVRMTMTIPQVREFIENHLANKEHFRTELRKKFF